MGGITYIPACTWETRGHNGPYERLPRAHFAALYISGVPLAVPVVVRSLGWTQSNRSAPTSGDRITRAYREPTRCWLALSPSALTSRNFREKLGIELERIR